MLRDNEIFLEQGVLSVRPQCSVYWRQIAASSQGIVTLILVEIRFIYLFMDNFHHHLISFMELGHLLTRSGFSYPEVSSKVIHDSYCQLGSSISLPWVITSRHMILCFNKNY